MKARGERRLRSQERGDENSTSTANRPWWNGEAIPRRGSTSCCCEKSGRTSPSRTPKDANHGHPRTFPCITGVSGDRGSGHHRHLGPLAADAVMVGEGHAPLRQYFLSLGTATGAMMAIADPSGRHPGAARPAAAGGRRPCPRCGSTCRVCKEADESIPDTKGRESWTPQAFSPANSQLPGDHDGGQ